MKLEYAPRSRSIYSDIGFILLGFLVPLQVEIPDLEFNPPPDSRSRIAQAFPFCLKMLEGAAGFLRALAQFFDAQRLPAFSVDARPSASP